jgi:hypothetical protein
MPRRPRRSPNVRNTSVPSPLPSRLLKATSLCAALVAGALCFGFVSNLAVATFVDSNRDLGVLPPVLPPRAVNDAPTNVRHETSNEAVREMTAEEQQALDEAKRREHEGEEEEEEEAQQRAVHDVPERAAEVEQAPIAAEAAAHVARQSEAEPAATDEPRNDTKPHEDGGEEQQQRLAAPVKDVTDPAPFLSSFFGRVQALSFTVAQLAVGTVIGGRRLMM